MHIKTTITSMLDINLPIIGAPMFLVSYPDLVVAVSEAGGMGTFPALNYRTPDSLRDALKEIRDRTDKPIGVNLILYKKHNPDWPRQLEICLEAKVELFITSLGSPRSVVREAHSIGAKVFCDVTTRRHAEVVAKTGADALIAVSQGAGGHAGAISPFSLIPYLKQDTGLPIVAAGSIGTGLQMAAAFSLGADAVYLGTRLIATNEAAAGQDYKEMLTKAQPEDIEYTDRISGIPANWLKESIARAESDPEKLAAEKDEYKRWRDIWSAGHGVAQIDSILPAADVLANMVQDYKKTIKHLPPVQ